MAIRFQLPKGGVTDIVAISHNGFIVGTGEDFRDLFAAATSTTPTSPHPTPIEKFLGAHPMALKFITDQTALPASFANLGFFGNNAFVFVDSAGTRRAGRYQILPEEGIKNLDSAAAAKTTPTYLFDDLTRRLARGPVKYKLFVQLANPGDQTKDGSLVWPDDRKKVEIGTLSLTTVAPDNEALQRKLMYSPILLTDGIQLGDDPLPVLRASVYALSVAHR
jgi:catalase